MDEKSKLKEEIALELAKIGALKFGEFTFKSGIVSPMYLDLRLFVSYPKLLRKVTKAYVDMIKDLEYDRSIGVAYGALPIAGALSLELERPWCFVRKEALAKAYGLEKSIEGEYEKGDRALVVEDLVTKGTSIMEVIPVLKRHGFKVSDAVFLIDYGKGGPEKLIESGVTAHAFMTMSEVVDIMLKNKVIDEKMYKKAKEFLSV